MRKAVPRGAPTHLTAGEPASAPPTQKSGLRPKSYPVRTNGQLTGLPGVALNRSAQGQELTGRKRRIRRMTRQTANRGNMFLTQIVIGTVLALLWATLGLP